MHLTQSFYAKSVIKNSCTFVRKIQVIIKIKIILQ